MSQIEIDVFLARKERTTDFALFMSSLVVDSTRIVFDL